MGGRDVERCLGVRPVGELGEAVHADHCADGLTRIKENSPCLGDFLMTCR
jgi:hypothetical protein